MSVTLSMGRFAMDIISGIECHRRWRLEEKFRIAAEAEAPGAVFALVARRHKVPARAAGEQPQSLLRAVPLDFGVRLFQQQGALIFALGGVSER